MMILFFVLFIFLVLLSSPSFDCQPSGLFTDGQITVIPSNLTVNGVDILAKLSVLENQVASLSGLVSSQSQLISALLSPKLYYIWAPGDAILYTTAYAVTGSTIYSSGSQWITLSDNGPTSSGGNGHVMLVTCPSTVANLSCIYELAASILMGSPNSAPTGGQFFWATSSSFSGLSSCTPLYSSNNDGHLTVDNGQQGTSFRTLLELPMGQSTFLELCVSTNNANSDHVR